MSEDRLGAIRERCEAATPGPWELDKEYDEFDGETGYYPTAIRAAGESILDIDGYYGQGEDCDFMAHARDDIPYLLERLAAAEARLAALVAGATALLAAWGNDAGELEDWSPEGVMAAIDALRAALAAAPGKEYANE